MNKIGYLIIGVSFLFGSYFCVLDPKIVQWTYVIIALCVGSIGLVLIYLDEHNRKQTIKAETKNITVLKDKLTNIVKNLTTMNDEKEKITDPYEVKNKIDELFLDDLDKFIEARETITHIFGILAYGAVMSHFAGGERYLNRVWSASADGYIDEVKTYIEKALDQFQKAKARFEEAQSAA